MGLAQKSLKISINDSKVYYKLRHNMLKTYILNSFNLGIVEEKPFSLFEETGLTSERTPDYLIKVDDGLLLMEFTYSSKYNSVLKNKKVFSKYDYELRNSKVPIFDYYLFLTLEGDVKDLVSMMTTISAKYGFPLTENFDVELEGMHNIVKEVTTYLNDYLPDLLTLNIDDIDINFPVTQIVVPEPFNVYENLRGVKSNKNVRIKSAISRCFRNLQRAIKRKPNDGHYRLNLNFSTNKVFIVEVFEGLMKHELQSMLDNEDLNVCDYTDVVGDVYIEDRLIKGIKHHYTEEDLNRSQVVNKKVDSDNYLYSFNKLLNVGKMTTVADSDLNIDSIKVEDCYLENLNKRNTGENIRLYKKSPFIFYPCDYLKKGEFEIHVTTDSEICNFLINRALGKSTVGDRIIERDVDYDTYMKYSREVTIKGRMLRLKYKGEYKELLNLKLKKLEDVAKVRDISDILEFKALRSNFSSIVKENTRIAYQNRMRINVKINNRWVNDMKHFQKEHNKTYTIGEYGYEKAQAEYRCFLSELFETGPCEKLDDVFSDTVPLGDTLAGFCTQMRKDVEEHLDLYQSTRLAHSTLLISQVCHAVMYYSNIKLNSDDFIYDNLGYKNVLLMVKGGKKIKTTRYSRFFRLLIPVTQIQSTIIDSSSNQLYNYQGSNYLLTPWRMLRLTYLKKGFETYHNFSNYYISSKLESDLTLLEFNKFVSLKVLCLFSQKRKLEVWISTLRYIYLNSLSTHSDVLTLIKDMPIVDTDSLIYYLQRSFAYNYREIFLHVKDKKLFDLIWHDSVSNFDLMAERFEENIFMSRAPFNPYNEHLNNLKSVFDTHKYYMDHVKSLDPMVGLEKTAIKLSDNYFENLEENDFNFDPKMSYLVGNYIGKFISSVKSEAELHETFNDIFHRNFTEISTSKGMRDSEGIFWGKKGHEVVFDKLKLDVGSVLNDFPQDPISFNKMVSQFEIDFVEQIGKLGDLTLEFDLKDKEQYKGSREIYVMSDRTKLLQNPLEKFFASLCKCLPNEIIHKPSNARPKFIHSKIFEFEHGNQQVMYCTMDCRKWAPRSNLWKYFYFVKGMAPFLPETFVDYFFKFWTLMFKKRIRIQKHFIDKLILSPNYENIKDFLNEREDGDFELIMPYSFMMGIFNYLSSLMHAASQLYFSNVLVADYNVSVSFLAHSDDSAGIIVSRDYKSCLKYYSFYEKFQRSLNHLMSRKKCALSKRSFELISIMYCDQRFVPMTHKFISNIAFDPKGAGWYNDITTVVGKVVDLFNNGGSLMQCYLLMLTMSEMLRKAYHLPRTKLLSHVPLALGGIFNMHPIHLILMGSSAQEYLLDFKEDEERRMWRIQQFCTVTGSYSLNAGNNVKYQISYVRTHHSQLELTEKQKETLSAVSTLPLKSTLIAYLKHNNKLFDKQYIYSLTGIDTQQLLLATLFFPCSVKIDDKLVKLKDLTTIYLTSSLIEGLAIDKFSYPTGNFLSYVKQVEKIKFNYQDFNFISQKSCKPVVYNTLVNYNYNLSNNTLMTLSAIEKMPELREIFYDPSKFDVLRDYMMNSLPGTVEEKTEFLKSFDPSEKVDKVRSGYLFMPSQVKVDTLSRFFTYSMCYTTRRYKISNKKPQFFVPDDLELLSNNIDYLKHLCICFKILEKDLAHSDQVLNSIVSCPCCSLKSGLDKHLKDYISMFSHRDHVNFKPKIPFIDYLNTQIRGKNVWFSGSDFVLYTPFGSVENKIIEGNIHTTWILENQDMLAYLWELYNISCATRGISVDKPVYQDTGFSYPKVAFNDFKTPYLPQTYTNSIVLANSKVIIKEYTMPNIYKSGKKFFLSDRNLDFKLNSVYDINQSFYNKHNLEGLKNIIYHVDLEVDEKILIENFDDSKIYKVLICDKSHFSNNANKYNNNGLLGNNCSFTRSLALADEEGLTRYRSSYNQMYIDKGVLEYDTIGGVPILDMFEKVNLARLTPFEKRSFEKCLGDQDLNFVDKRNLINIRNKLGLEALGTAIVLHKHVFKEMLAGMVKTIPSGILKNVLITMIKAIHECMETYPSTRNKKQFAGDKKSWWSILKTLLTTRDMSLLGIHLASGLLRSKLDSEHKFWKIISQDILLSMLSINNDHFNNLISMCRGLLISLKDKKELLSVFYVEDQVKWRPLFFARDLYEELDLEYDLINNVISCEGEALIIDEDTLDEITAFDMDVEDMEGEERVWSGPDLKAVCWSYNDIKKLMQETASKEFTTITLAAPHNYLCFPWLGRGDYKYEKVDGVNMFVSKFPGGQYYVSKDFKDIQLSKAKELRDKLEECKEEEEEEKIIPKILRNRQEAEDVLKFLNIYNPKIVSALFPEKDIDFKNITDMLLGYFDMFVEGFDVKLQMIKRSNAKFNLPGFQGILEDNYLKAELNALFGDNFYHLLTGNFNITKSSYDLYMSLLKRNYNRCSNSDKSLSLFMLALLQDCCITNRSDSWFLDKINEIAFGIDQRSNRENEEIIMPVLPQGFVFEYTEKDIFG
jgi:hypothetical protein